MLVRFSSDPEMVDAVTRLAEQCGAEGEDQRVIFRETFVFVAQKIGLEQAKSLIGELSQSAADPRATPARDRYLPLIMGIVRGYLRNSRTVLTEEFLDGMGQRVFEFAYYLGYQQGVRQTTPASEGADDQP